MSEPTHDPLMNIHELCATCGHQRRSHSSGGICDGEGTECYCVRFPDAPDFAELHEGAVISPIVVQGPEGAQEERKSLEAVIHYAVEKGDEDGALSTDEGWAIARAVADELTNGSRRTTSSIPGGFYVHAVVEREEPQ